MHKKHYYSSYIIVGYCSWSAILIVYLVYYCKIIDFIGCEIMHNCMALIPTHCSFKYMIMMGIKCELQEQLHYKSFIKLYQN